MGFKTFTWAIFLFFNYFVVLVSSPNDAKNKNEDENRSKAVIDLRFLFSTLNKNEPAQGKTKILLFFPGATSRTQDSVASVGTLRTSHLTVAVLRNAALPSLLTHDWSVVIFFVLWFDVSWLKQRHRQHAQRVFLKGLVFRFPVFYHIAINFVFVFIFCFSFKLVLY